MRQYRYEDTHVGEEGPHSQFCTCSVECREHNAFRKGDFSADGALFDDDAYRIGEGDWDSHWFHVERVERPLESFL